jgi:ABC-2 type transport system permease protein
MIFEKSILRFIGRLDPLWQKAGIDGGQLKTILKVKLIMDNRRAPTFNSNRRGSDPMVMQTIMNVVFGLFLAMILSMNQVDTTIRFLFFHSALLVFFTIMIISEFSTILFDTRDNIEILPRPVNSRTYYASKIVHIVIYLLYLGVPLSIGGVVISLFKFGVITSLLQIALTFLNILIAVFISNLFYMGIIRLFSAKKIKDVVMYIQVFLAIVIYGGYQLLPRLFGSKAFTEAHLSGSWWTYLVPPVWSAKISAMWVGGNLSEIVFPLLLNLLVPLVGLWVIVKFFAPLYNQKLSQLDSAVKAKKIKGATAKRGKRYLIGLLPVSTLEKAYYVLILKNISQDRKFKQATYSLFGYFIVLMLIPVFSKLNHPAEIIASLATSKKYFLFLYFPVFMCYIVQAQVQFSDQHEASWQYLFLPIEHPGQLIFSGMLYVLVRFFIPLMIFTNTIVLVIWPLDVLPQVVLSWPLSLLVLGIMSLFSDKYLPLSRSRNMQNSSRNLMRMFFVFFLAAVLYGIVYVCSVLPRWATFLVVVVVFLGMLFVFRMIRRIPWKKIII